MQGYSEFVVTGNLKGWDSWDRLKDIKVKALMIGAEHDEMDPEEMKKMAEMMPNATAAICPGGSHGILGFARSLLRASAALPSLTLKASAGKRHDFWDLRLPERPLGGQIDNWKHHKGGQSPESQSQMLVVGH